jgi:hypothetical protein
MEGAITMRRIKILRYIVVTLFVIILSSVSYLGGYYQGSLDTRVEELELRLKVGAILLRDFDANEFSLLRSGILAVLSGDYQTFLTLTGLETFRMGHSRAEDQIVFQKIHEVLKEEKLLPEDVAEKAEILRQDPKRLPLLLER